MRSLLSYTPCKGTCPPLRYDNNPRPVAPSALSGEPSRVPPPRRRTSVALGSMWSKSLTPPTSNFKGSYGSPASSATAQRGIGFSLAEILDPANFKRSYGSSEKDAYREPAAAVVAVAGHLVSSLSTPVYVLGAIPKISVSCEQL